MRTHGVRRLAITFAAAAILVPAAHADPARYRLEYLKETAIHYGRLDPWAAHALRASRRATVPQDVRDHRKIKQLVAEAGAPVPSTAVEHSGNADSFNWGDAGAGAAAMLALAAVLVAATRILVRRRAASA